VRDIDNGKDVNDMKDRNDMRCAAETPGAKGIPPARKWIGIGVLAAGVVLAGISFDIMQSRATAGGAAAQPGALQLAPRLSVDQSRERIAEYYAEKLGGPVTVEIKDFGCHQEAEVLKDGKLVKRLSISGGAVNEIG